LLHRERRAERRREAVRSLAGVAEDALRNAVAAARASDSGGELGELQLHAAALAGAVDLREDMQRDRADRERSGRQQRLLALADAQAHAVDREAGSEREVGRARTGAQHV